MWNLDELQRFVAMAEGSPDPYAPALILALSLGVRLSELLGLTRQSFDLEHGVVTVDKTLSWAGGTTVWGSADEQKPAAEGTVEAWARSPENPVGGWYGLKKGLRGRFATYVPPVMEVLKLAEVEHHPKNNRMRAL